MTKSANWCRIVSIHSMILTKHHHSYGIGFLANPQRHSQNPERSSAGACETAPAPKQRQTLFVGLNGNQSGTRPCFLRTKTPKSSSSQKKYGGWVPQVSAGSYPLRHLALVVPWHLAFSWPGIQPTRDPGFMGGAAHHRPTSKLAIGARE